MKWLEPSPGLSALQSELCKVPSFQNAAHRSWADCASWLELHVALGNRSGEAALLDLSVFVLLVHSNKCSSTVRGVDVKRKEGIQ